MKIRNMKQVTERVKGLKGRKLFRRNQIIITTLAVMIAAAGYLNYAGKRDLEAGSRLSQAGSLELSEEDLMAENLAAQSETVSDILSLDNDPAEGEVAEAGPEDTSLALGDNGAGGEASTQEGELSGNSADAENTGESADPAGYENPGEAVMVSNSIGNDYFSSAKLAREQSRAKNKETLMEIINNKSLDAKEKKTAVNQVAAITDAAEKENAAELMLEAKGFEDAVVSITDDSADIVINAGELTSQQIAQVQDIVKRKAGIAADKIVITPVKVKSEK